MYKTNYSLDDVEVLDEDVDEELDCDCDDDEELENGKEEPVNELGSLEDDDTTLSSYFDDSQFTKMNSIFSKMNINIRVTCGKTKRNEKWVAQYKRVTPTCVKEVPDIDNITPQQVNEYLKENFDVTLRFMETNTREAILAKIDTRLYDEVHKMTKQELAQSKKEDAERQKQEAARKKAMEIFTRKIKPDVLLHESNDPYFALVKFVPAKSNGSNFAKGKATDALVKSIIIVEKLPTATEAQQFSDLIKLISPQHQIAHGLPEITVIVPRKTKAQQYEAVCFIGGETRGIIKEPRFIKLIELMKPKSSDIIDLIHYDYGHKSTVTTVESAKELKFENVEQAAQFKTESKKKPDLDKSMDELMKILKS